MIVLYHETTLRLEQHLACVGLDDLDFAVLSIPWRII